MEQKTSTNIPELNMADFTYDLPASSIAQFPLAERDASRLLVADVSSQSVIHSAFRNIAAVLRERLGPSCIVLNDTKVMPARLLLQKPTGGSAEVLLTEPARATDSVQQLLNSTNESEWKALIGGRNITVGLTLTTPDADAEITVLERRGKEGYVRVLPRNATLYDVLMRSGHVPLPPYIHRADTELDTERYQTVFARNIGSVAAPTAGLHITPSVLSDLQAHGHRIERVTLHVGLGTFLPVSVGDARNHVMHSERIRISTESLQRITDDIARGIPIVPVGTTSMRTLESIHWLGAQLCSGIDLSSQACFTVDQFDAYNQKYSAYSALEAYTALTTFLTQQDIPVLEAESGLMLAPGASIRITDALITNFHQPGSTLLLLVASMMGSWWNDVYAEALQHQYRFLSYGDAMCIVRTNAGTVATT